MSLIVTTKSGTRYEFAEGAVRRLSGSHEMRRDDEWLELQNQPEIVVGREMILLLPQLGNADYPFTTRITSPVVSIE